VHVDPYVRARSDLNAKTVANHLTLLIAMLNMACHELKWITVVPRIKKPRIRRGGEDYRYLRTVGEIDRFLAAAAAESAQTHALYAVAVFTGMRAGEIAGLRWEDVDFTGCGSFATS
jgi:integrase